MTDPIAEARQLLAWLDKEGYPVGSWQHATVTTLLSLVERLTAPVAGDRAELVKRLRSPPLFTSALMDAAAALLEADARREAALIEAIREFAEDLGPHSRLRLLAILAKVSAKGVGDAPGSSLEDWVRDIAAGRADGGER